MGIDRRAVLMGLAAAPLAPRALAHVPNDDAAPGDSGGSLYAAALRDRDGAYRAAIFRADGAIVRQIALPARGHDTAVCPRTGRCVVFARRPGNFAVAFSPDDREPPVVFTTPEDRHFYGHGVFSRDGRLLYATENAFDAGEGRIGVYDASAGFRREGELPTYGVGPHGLALLRRTPTLVIANGGMREHPNVGAGRRVLNPEALRPSLSYVDTRTGDLLERHEPAAASGRLSLRHLDVGARDEVVIGAQLDGPGATGEALLYRHTRQRSLASLTAGLNEAALLGGYVSSVAVDRAGTVAAFTSSRTGCTLIVDIALDTVLRVSHWPDVSGVARAPETGRFVITTGTGLIVSEGPNAVRPASAHAHAWDNHVTAMAAGQLHP